MSLNILDLVKDQVTGALAGQAASFLGESESGVAKALGGMMPALLGGAIQKASQPSGAQGLMDLLGGLDTDGLSDIAGIFGGGASKVNNVMNSGGGILDMLMGNKTSGIVDLIAGMAGLKQNSTSSLLKLAAPFLMGIIAKQVKGKGLSALTDLLSGQKSHVASAMPAGLGNLLGFSAMGDAGDEIKKTVSAASSTVSNASREAATASTGGGMGWLKWLLPLLLLGGLAWWFMNKGKGEVAEAVDTTTEVVTDAATTAVDATTDAATTAVNFTKKFASGFELKGATSTGIESQLIGFIEDAAKVVDKTTWFNFDRLLFDTGKATLQASSQEQLLNTAEILKEFPKVKLKIGGYTDSDGDDKANLKLSQDRANTVLAELVKLGVDKARLGAEGYGEQFPVGDNATEEGKQQNRRIALRVTEK